MQNLPVTASPPASPAQAATPTDNSSAAPASEPFGSVLARQRANADASQDGRQADGKPSATSASAANDASAAAIGNDAAVELPPATPDVSGTLTADMLAALLPAAASTSSAQDNEKTDKQAPAPDNIGTLPGDMLAMLLPAAAITNRSAAGEKGRQEVVPDEAGKARSQPIATAIPGETQTAAGIQAATEIPAMPVAAGIPRNAEERRTTGAPKVTGDAKATEDIKAAGTSAPLHTQGSAKPEAAATRAGKENTFAAALEASGKDGAKTAQADLGTVKVSVQPAESTALNGLLQSGIAPIAAVQNGAAQAVQAAIHTPVTHEAWGDEFSQKITWMATQREQSAALHLNPPNLGPLDVVLNVSGDQATALFTSPHAAVRDVLEQALPKLRDMLADNGITLGNAMVSDQSPKDQQAWQAEQRQKGSGGSGKSGAAIAAGNMPPVIAASLSRRHQGMVDTFA